MKKIFALLLALTLVFLAGCNQQVQWNLPDFSMYTAEGEEVKLSDYAGKPIIVNFWASWCPPCASEMPDFQEAFEDYGHKIQFVMVNVTTWENEAGAADAFLKEGGYTFPVFYDNTGDAAQIYQINSIPQTLFISAEGKVIGWERTMVSESTLRSYIKKLLA